MIARLAAVGALVRLVAAFTDTAPVVAWASKRSEALELLPASFAESGTVTSVLEHVFADSSVCSHDAVFLIDQPSLHAADLRTLSPTSALTESIGSALSSIQLPYVRRSSVEESTPSLEDVANSLASRCGSRAMRYEPTREGRPALEKGQKHVLSIDLPAVVGAGALRKADMTAHESLLSKELEGLAAIFPDYLVVYTSSSPAPALAARQFPSAPDPRPLIVANETLPAGGILARYQLLTPGLITALLVSFFLLVPAVMMGVSALASIRSPLQMGAPKSFNAQERKNQ